MSALANCSEYRELISASLDGALTPEEQEKLDAHLSECLDCRTMWEQLSALEPELMELSEPSEGFADRVLALHQGTVAAHGPAREVLTPALIRKLYRVETALADTRGGSVLVPLTEGEK